MTASASTILNSPGVTVFCGSSSGKDPLFLSATQQLGAAIARSGETLVYGGGMNGLMGAVACAALDAGGKVHGVLPQAFINADRTSTYKHFVPSLPGDVTPDTVYVQTPVESMHERKKLMATVSHAFIALPGGYGTLEELAEVTTWTQLGIHKKPVVLLNIRNFYTPLRAFVESAIDSGFISPKNRAFITFVDGPSEDDEADFDWGEAALKAVKDWEQAGLGGGEAYSLEWGSSGAPKDTGLQLS